MPVPKDPGVSLTYVTNLLHLDERQRDRWVAEIWHERVPIGWTRWSGDRRNRPAFAGTAHAHLGRLVIACAAMAPKQPFHAISYNYDTLFEEAVAALGAPVEAIVEGPRLAWTSRRPVDHRGVLWPAGGRPATVQGAPSTRLAAAARPSVAGYAASDARGPGHPVRAGLSRSAGRMRGHPMNIAQIEAFGGRRCVFYGLSMQDDSVRALARMANAGTFASGILPTPHPDHGRRRPWYRRAIVRPPMVAGAGEARDRAGDHAES